MSLTAYVNGLIIDLFAGGGGASTGIELALGRSPDLGLNHSWDALRNHALNHPSTRHIVDDIREVVPLVATGGKPVDVLWASPDCRHFSRAKGGKPCHPEVRSLPWEVTRWAEQTRPRLICMENVPEMQDWGPLYDEHSPGCKGEPCAKGCVFQRPIPEQKGETWRAWVEAFQALGYEVASWVLHAHDYGAPTSRKRLIIVARLDGKPVKPEPTHGPGRAHPHRTAAECIDWEDLGESIFDAEGNTHHAPATLRRIATGVMRFVVNAKKPYVVGGHGRCMVQTSYGERAGQAPRVLDLHKPLGTVVAGTDMQSDGRLRGLTPMDEPLKTVTTGNGHALVAAFLSTYYGQSVGQPVDAPMATQTTKHKHAVVTVEIDGVTYAIVDIRMRMLKPSELKLAQGFPASYRLEGSQKLQVRLIGNSVPPQLAAAVVRANTPNRPFGALTRRSA